MMIAVQPIGGSVLPLWSARLYRHGSRLDATKGTWSEVLEVIRAWQATGLPRHEVHIEIPLTGE